jgi:hypothetical protein
MIVKRQAVNICRRQLDPKFGRITLGLGLQPDPEITDSIFIVFAFKMTFRARMRIF